MSQTARVAPTTSALMTGRTLETVVRDRLIRRLSQARDVPVALIVAPAGYGKTTLLSQWAERDSRPFAVLELHRADNDPRHLLESIARALSEVAPIGDDVFVALSTPGAAATGVLGALGRSLTEAGPVVLALDDVQVLDAAEALAALTVIADHLPAGAQLVLASRREPALPIGRLRAHRRLVELRAPDLAMTRREAAAQLHADGIALAPDDVATLWRRTEGWPAGLSLAALALQGEADRARAIRRFGGRNRVVADYLRDEVLAGCHGAEIRFLMRSSTLDVLSGPVCDATLGASGSGAMLRALARANMLLIGLDQSDEEYRYHPLLAEMLRAELRRAEPRVERELHRRAMGWYAAHGDFDRAIDHAAAATDADAAGRLLWANGAPEILSGRTAQIRSWLDRFGAEERAAAPGLALTFAATHLVRGERDLVEHWSAAAERGLGSEPSGADRRALQAGVAIMRAAVARHGLETMAEDAARAYALAADDSPWRPLSCLLSGVAAHLQCTRTQARSSLQEGARRGAISAPVIQVLCLAQLALIAIDESDWAEAEALSSRARAQVDRVGLADCPLSALAFAVSARVRAQHGRAEQAHDDRRAALRLLGRLTDNAPWYLAEVRIVLADAACRLGDVSAVRELLADAARDARDIPEAVVLSDWIEESSAAAQLLAENVAGPALLTAAELRVLQLLPTHLSFREMAGRFHVSVNTVKTHAHAVYRKLNACSRSEAVTRAREAGLLVDGVEELAARHEPRASTQQPQPDALTAAELQVLRRLPYELSFAEIGARLQLSAHTVRTHAEAAYRKLSVSSRSEAVERARALGLLVE